MQKIANLRDIERGKSITFNYKGNKALLVRTKGDKLVAYIAICPHEQGNIEWDGEINKFLCECHLSLFNVDDGSVYAHSSLFELKEGLTKIDLKVDEKGDIYAL
ncbi:MAG: Rieske (2Fe-2S) protein [Candidatus Bathyarchaeia archaeon]